MTPTNIIALVQTLCLLSVLALWATWGTVLWSQRKRLLRLWGVGVVGGALWMPATIALMSLHEHVDRGPIGHCGLGAALAKIIPVILGVPPMIVALLILTFATLVHRCRSSHVAAWSTSDL